MTGRLDFASGPKISTHLKF